MDTTPEAALRQAIERAGSVRALANALGVTGQAISQWTRVPVSRVLDVERVTGVSRHALRPDIYGTAPSDEAAA